MTKYIEKFEVPGDSFYGIEDFKDGQPMKDHFFGYRYDPKKDPRYLLWRGGCGIGYAETLEEARKKVFDYMRARLNHKRIELVKETEQLNVALDTLRDDLFNLGEFKVQKFSWEKEKA